MNEAPQDAVCIEDTGFLGGRVRLRQPVQGHRAGTDAVLLAAAAPADLAGLVLDLGAGVGGAGLALAALRPNVRLGLVEIDPFLVRLARDNLALNGLADRGFACEADILSPQSRRRAGLADASAALVITNPPFLDPARARVSPQPGKRQAHAMQLPGQAALTQWIAASLAMVAPGGLFILIHRPEVLPLVLQAVEGRAGAVTVLPVCPREGAQAIRILVRAKKGSRAPLAIAPALILHHGAAFTTLAEAIHRGAAVLGW
jgi:tRNA1(Val) A37 N6-methylase TrmN6